jgi:hypothetical protein
MWPFLGALAWAAHVVWPEILDLEHIAIGQQCL